MVSRRIRRVLAAALIAVFVLGALNVSVAGQRDRLRQRVRALNERVAALEQRIIVDEAFVVTTTNRLYDRTQNLSEDGTFHGVVSRNATIRPPIQHVPDTVCTSGIPAVWRGESDSLRLSC